jgi:dTDP-glucose pyrophosphorylase
MNIVIPMAGAGSRFIEAGYSTPKPLLKAHGKTLLEWSVDSMPLDLASSLIFVGLQKHQSSLEDLISNRYAKYSPQFIWLPETTRGQSETVLKAGPLLDLDESIAIFNIDTAFRSKSLFSNLLNPDCDGVLGSFQSTDPRFSFARLDKECVVIEVKEKLVISNHALTGFYHFTNTMDFIDVAESAIQNEQLEKGEYYVAPLYNTLIEKGAKFALDACDWCQILGSPEEYEMFLTQPPPRH